MGRENIEKWDWRYSFLKHYVNFSFRSFFKELTVSGKENIPENTPIIFAPNHQNALMDALAILYTTNDQPVFLARSDIFKKKLIAIILTFLKILPIYRIRDGYGNLKLNDYIIKKIHAILSKNHYLVIFPEGNHGDKRQLRNLKKGITRIAFQSEEEYDYKLGVKIVPVGLDYTNYYKFKENLFVNFGKPIDLDQFFPLYKENPSKAHLALRKEISTQLKKYMIHIDNQEYYETINASREIYKYRMKEVLQIPSLKQPYKFKADKKLIQLCEKIQENKPEQLAELDVKVKEYRKLLKSLNIDYHAIPEKKSITPIIIPGITSLILFSPIFLYGWINNLLSYYPAVHFSKKMRDPQFISSIKYGIGMVTFPLFYLIQTLLVYAFTKEIYITLGYLLSIPLTGYFAFYYQQLFKILKKKIRLNNIFRKKPETYKKLTRLKKDIIDKIDEWVNQYDINDGSI